MKRLSVILMFLTWSIILAGCGNVNFETSSGSVYRECTAVGADLSNCFNPNPTVLKNMSQSISVSAQSEVDILFVVDNSGSMSEEQQGIGNKISGFLSRINNLDWQIAVTTTDDRAFTPITGDSIGLE